MKNGRFMVGLVGVSLVVTYLIWTGVSETMVYYLTTTAIAVCEPKPWGRSVVNYVDPQQRAERRAVPIRPAPHAPAESQSRHGIVADGTWRAAK